MSLDKVIQKNNNVNVKEGMTDDFDFIQYVVDRSQFNGMFLLDKEGNRIVLIICKALYEGINNHIEQTGRYFSYNKSCKIVILTNMDDMYFFADFKTPGVMDEIPFYKIYFPFIKEQDYDFLELFRRDHLLDNYNELYAKWKEQYINNNCSTL